MNVTNRSNRTASSRNNNYNNAYYAKMTPLQKAIVSHNVREVQSVLKTKEGKRNINDFFCKQKAYPLFPITPLQYVILSKSFRKKWNERERLQTIELLMKHGADPNKGYVDTTNLAMYSYGSAIEHDTPVMSAVRVMDCASLKILLKKRIGRKRANLSKITNGSTLLNMVIEFSTSKFNSPRGKAEYHKNKIKILDLLLKAGASPNATGRGRILPLVAALLIPDYVAARKLIEHGATLKPYERYATNAHDEKGVYDETIAEVLFGTLAHEEGNIFTQDTLRDYEFLWGEYFKKGGSPNTFLYGTNTILSEICGLKKLDTENKKRLLTFFISKGASIQKRNKDGTRPIDFLRESIKNSPRTTATNQIHIRDMIRMLGGTEHKKNVTLLTNINTTDPITLNTVRLDNAYILKPDIVNATIQTKNGRKSIRTVRQIYSKSSLNNMIRSGRTFKSPVTRRPFTPFDVIKLTDVVPENHMNNFKKNFKNSL